MLIVKVELHSAITGEVSRIAEMRIANTGGTRNLGDYAVDVFRGRDEKALTRRTVLKRGTVKGHPRLREHVWNLVAKALNNTGYGK